MNYSDIKKQAEAKKILLKEVSEAIGITPNGLRYSMENDTLPMDKVRKLCKILGISIGDFFGETSTNVVGNGNILNNNIVKSSIDNRHYYSDSPDVLRAQIDLLDERIKEKDSQIKEKDSQIKEKDSQIKELLNILKNNK